MKNESTNTPLRSAEAKEKQDYELDLVDLFGYYASRLPLLIIAVIVGALISGLFTKFMVPNKYTATSRMYMVSASSDAVVNLSDLNLGTSISNDYVELMRTRPIIMDVIDKLELPYTYEQLLGMINLSVVSNTRIVKISVTSTSPQEAMNVANQLARTAKVQLPKVMDAPSPTIAEDAVLPQVKSSPSLSRNVLIGALLCLLAVMAVLTVLYLQDDTLKTSEEVEKEFGIMPLSVIPEGIIEGLTNQEEQHRKLRRSSRRERSKA